MPTNTRREFIKTAGLGAATLALPGSSRAAKIKRPPNVIMIMADDIGFECYGCYGSDYYSTPNIDKLAATGARFDHAYSQPLCTPSRVRIMTGKYNFRNYQQFTHLDLSQTTFAHAVKKAGYKSCVAGKWQLSHDNLEGPYQAGFDDYCLWHFMNTLGGPQVTGNKGSRFKSPRLFDNGVEMKGLEGKYGPDIVSDHICKFIDSAKDDPFFVYYPMILVHSPFVPTPDSVDWDADKSEREPLECFRDMVHYMDKIVGKIVAKLDEHGLREDTLIMVTGDNGTHKSLTSPFPARGVIKGGKGTMQDAGTHVAFVANWPGKIKPKTVVETPIDFSDVFPTITEVTGAPTPDDLDGKSFWPLLHGDTKGADGWVFCSYAPQGPAKQNFRYFVRDKRYKLYATGELYDVPNDWDEETPLNTPETEPIRKRLQAILDDILKDAPEPQVAEGATQTKKKETSK